MAKTTRMSAEERRKSILTAAIPLFARHGFKGTTTKMIAKASGISEALLYRHFNGKDAIYDELKSYCCQGKTRFAALITNLKPSTSTLIHAIYFLMFHIADGLGHDNNSGYTHDEIHRLMANSYLENGNFARIFIQQNVDTWAELLEECIEQAKKSGDMLEDWIDTPCRYWFAHHVAVALGLLDLPSKPTIDYGAPRQKVLEQAVRFSLRGMGITDEAIATHYNPEMLELFAKGLRTA